MVWLSGLQRLMAEVNTNMAKDQERYNRDFDQRVRIPRNRVRIGSRVLIREDYHPTDYPSHKLVPLATGLNTVTEVNERPELL